ncbi:unnamed protein product [Sympodiomycopsis kandeliae]
MDTLSPDCPHYFRSSGEIPLLKTIAARKLSSTRHSHIASKGQGFPMSREQVLPAEGFSRYLSGDSQPTPSSTANSQETPLFAALSAWRFSDGSSNPSRGEYDGSSSDATAIPSSSSLSLAAPSSSRARSQSQRKTSLRLADCEFRSCRSYSSRPETGATSDVAAAAEALAGLTEDGFESAVALSKQWRDGQQPTSPSYQDSLRSSTRRSDHLLSPPRPHPPPKSVPVVCRHSISWHDGEDEMSPNLDLDVDVFPHRDTLSGSISSDWSLENGFESPLSRTASISDYVPESGTRSRRLSSLQIGHEFFQAMRNVNRSSQKLSFSALASSLRFRSSVASRTSVSSGVSSNFHQEESPYPYSNGNTSVGGTSHHERLDSVADELALMSELAMSDTTSSQNRFSFSLNVAPDEAA